MVRYIRASLEKAYSRDCLDKLRKPFKKEEWEDIQEKALERRKTGELSAEIADDFDLLGVNHFSNLFEAYYDDLCESVPDIKKAQKTKEKQVILQWTRTVKSLRDPLSHPSEDDFSFEDAFILLDSARRVLLRLKLKDDADNIAGLMSNLGGRPYSAHPDIEPLEDRLPPRESVVVEFIGRDAERKKLWAWFEDTESRRWALAGEGGKGKSALAFRFATEVKVRAPKPFQIVLWLSAKKRKFQEGHVVPLSRPDFYDLDSALSCILTYYGWIEETKWPLEKKQLQVLELVNQFPAFIIVDDIDSLEYQDEDAIAFFSFNVPQTKSKVLFTSRRVVFGMANTTTHIGGFTDQDAKHFISSRAQLMGIDTTILTESLIQDIMRVTENSPLYIEDLMRFLVIVPPNKAVSVWAGKAGEDARRYALMRELDHLSKGARHVLLAACISDGPVSFPELQTVTDFSEDQLSNSLEELQRLFLVPKPRLIEGEQRFEPNLNTRTLVRKELRLHDAYRRIESAYKAMSGELPRIAREDIAAIIRQTIFHIKAGEEHKAEQLLLQALKKHPNHPQFMGFLGWVYKKWDPPRVNEARERFRRAWQLKSNDEPMYIHWIQMELREHEWTKAAEAAEKGLKLLPDSRRLLYLAGYAQSRLGKELQQGLHHEKARERLEKARVLLEQALEAPDVGDERLNGDIYRAVVLNYESLGYTGKLNYYLKLWLEKCPDDLDALSERDRLSLKLGLS